MVGRAVDARKHMANGCENRRKATTQKGVCCRKRLEDQVAGSRGFWLLCLPLEDNQQWPMIGCHLFVNNSNVDHLPRR
jgi:hypothetical protein